MNVPWIAKNHMAETGNDSFLISESSVTKQKEN
jgi:hypothetical protein